MQNLIVISNSGPQRVAFQPAQPYAQHSQQPACGVKQPGYTAHAAEQPAGYGCTLLPQPVIAHQQPAAQHSVAQHAQQAAQQLEPPPLGTLQPLQQPAQQQPAQQPAQHAEQAVTQSAAAAADLQADSAPRKKALYAPRKGRGLYARTPPCLLYTSPSPRDRTRSRMPSSA